MKGIKECLNWMFENPMKVIESKDEYWSYRYNDRMEVFELKTVHEKEEEFRSVQSFERLKYSDWKEVIEPVDFITAYNDCLKNNVRYYKEKDNNFKMFGYNGRVTIIDDSEFGNTTTLTCDWIKVG